MKKNNHTDDFLCIIYFPNTQQTPVIPPLFFLCFEDFALLNNCKPFPYQAENNLKDAKKILPSQFYLPFTDHEARALAGKTSKTICFGVV